MRGRSGQVARGVGRLLHRVAALALTGLVVVAVVLAAVAWRLSQGPVDLAWLTSRIEAAANVEGGPVLAIGGTALTWEGFRQGVDRPLDLRLTGITVTDPGGGRRIEIPRAELSLSLRSLLLGRIVPRAVELNGARLTVLRAADGTVSLDLGTLLEATDTASPPAERPGPSLPALFAEMARPATTDQTALRGWLSQLRVVAIRGAVVTVIDRQLGATWRAPHADIDLRRRAGGGVDGSARLDLALGDQRAELTLAATWRAGAEPTRLRGWLTPVTPAALARAAPSLTPLAALDAPVALQAELEMGAALDVHQGRLTVQIGAGRARFGGDVAVAGGEIIVAGTPERATIDAARITLRGREAGPPTTVQATGTVRREAGRISAALAVAVDRVDFADLPALWPAGLADGARAWITENIPAGVARDARVDFAIDAAADFSSVTATRAAGTLEGEDLTVHWLRPVPPIAQGQAQLRIVDPDTIEIVVRSARQHGSARAGDLAIRGGRMRITGLTAPDQAATIQADIAGPLANAIALLREPRLHLLDAHPVDLKDPAGEAVVNLTVSLPLDQNVRIEDIGIRAAARLTAVHLTGLAAGRDIDQGAFDLTADSDGMTVKGRSLIAGIAAQVDASLDFRAGPPTQVVQRVAVSGRPGAGQLTAAGLDPVGMVFGDFPMDAVLIERRNGEGEVAVTADLTPATLAADPIGWRKPAGAPAKGSARVLIARGRLKAIDRIVVEGSGVSLRGSAECQDGRISAVRLDRAVLGETDGRGIVRLPAGGPIGVEVSGPRLDMSAKVTEKAPKRDAAKPEPPGPAWTLNARFDQVKLAGGQSAAAVSARADNDGRVFRALHLSGEMAGKAPFSVAIEGGRGARRLTARAADAGAFLRGLDAVRVMEAGRLSIQGTYDDAAAGHPLSGTITIDEFRLRGAPALGKLLQAMTLYGLVDVLKGPGIGFSQLVAPFRLDDQTLTLHDARAFSPSLGLTAKGSIARDDNRADIEGTIVPAYFFNSLLGNIPLVGKLFSPERGGGVFAARYTVRGPLDDPTVFVNPLSALTPGFLREIFGIF